MASGAQRSLKVRHFKECNIGCVHSLWMWIIMLFYRTDCLQPGTHGRSNLGRILWQESMACSQEQLQRMTFFLEVASAARGLERRRLWQQNVCSYQTEQLIKYIKIQKDEITTMWFDDSTYVPSVSH